MMLARLNPNTSAMIISASRLAMPLWVNAAPIALPMVATADDNLVQQTIHVAQPLGHYAQ